LPDPWHRSSRQITYLLGGLLFAILLVALALLALLTLLTLL